MGERDPVVGELQRQYPGLRPVGFWSPAGKVTPGRTRETPEKLSWA